LKGHGFSWGVNGVSAAGFSPSGKLPPCVSLLMQPVPEQNRAELPACRPHILEPDEMVRLIPIGHLPQCVAELLKMG
jgi:hypothetical protein